jgi:hypothetical protein
VFCSKPQVFVGLTIQSMVFAGAKTVVDESNLGTELLNICSLIAGVPRDIVPESSCRSPFLYLGGREISAAGESLSTLG